MIPGLLRGVSQEWLPTPTVALPFAQCWDWKTIGKPSCATKRFEGGNVITSDAQRDEYSCSWLHLPLYVDGALLVVVSAPSGIRTELQSRHLFDLACSKAPLKERSTTRKVRNALQVLRWGRIVLRRVMAVFVWRCKRSCEDLPFSFFQQAPRSSP